MRKSTRSILQELSDLGVKRDADLIIESRGSNVIDSAINLLELISKHYDSEKAQVLERKLLSAIKARDQGKFSKSIRKDNESQ